MEKKTTCTARGISGKLSFDSTPHASLCNDDAHQAGSFHFKSALPVDEQIDHLVEQGIVVENRQFAEFCLLTSNYYRLRGYWMTFEEDGAIRAGTRLEDIWAIHEFDREVRLWLWKLIERVEIKARTQFAYVLSNEFGADAHLQAELFLYVKEQLVEKDKQISELTEMIRNQQKLTLLQQQKNDQLINFYVRITGQCSDFQIMQIIKVLKNNCTLNLKCILKRK